MNGEPPLVRLAWRDQEGELHIFGTESVSLFACVPSVGDILYDTMPFSEPLRVRRRVFIQMTGEPDIWWLLVDSMPDDPELAEVMELDAHVRAEFKALEEEAEMERYQKLDKLLAETKKKKSPKMPT